MADNKAKKSSSKKSSPKEIDFQALAHAGTKEAINKLEACLKQEKDQGKLAEARLALEECELFYYSPANEKEEKDFLLCRIIWQKENRVQDLEMEKESLEARLERFELEKAVHEKVLLKHKNKREDWKYNVMDEFVSTEENRIKEIKEEIAYEKAWTDEAKKMIATARYKPCIPGRHLEHVNFEGFDESGGRGDFSGADGDHFNPDEIPF